MLILVSFAKWLAARESGRRQQSASLSRGEDCRS
jgi:hypothetical protein